jgi:hypothetical protein
MVTVDQLEILLRTIPQYFLFAALSLYLIGWMNRKDNLSLIADILLITTGILSIILLSSGMIPSPKDQGMNEEHILRVIKMLFLFVINGGLTVISLTWRLVKKAPLKPLLFIIFVISIIIFFQSTGLSKIKFELNKQPLEVVSDTIK